jgi:uncharacterized protein DUF5060
MNNPVIPQWGLFEQTFTTDHRHDNPFTDVRLSVQFSHNTVVHVVDGFYDGEEDGRSLWRVRFAPMAQGRWTYVTSSNESDLDGSAGEFDCAAGESRGGLTSSHQFPNWFFRADGSPQFVLNDGWTPHPGSKYGIEEYGAQVFTYPTEEQYRTFITVLSRHNVNMTIDLKQLYARQKTCTDTSFLWPWKVVEPETHKIDRERFSLKYFQRLDRQIAYALEHNVFYGVEVLYDNSTFRKQEWANHPYNETNGGWIRDWDAPTDEYTTDQLPFGWGIRRILDLNNATHMTYLTRMVSYLTARTSAYWNVFYAMGCETSNIYPGQADLVDRWYTWWGDYMASRDPHGRLLTIGDVGSRDSVGWDDIDPKSAFVYRNARNNLITTQEHTFTDDIHDYSDAIHRFGVRFWKFRRPTVIGEQDGRNNNKYPKERRGYWAAFTSGFMMGRIDRHYEMADGDLLRESTLFGSDDDPAIYRYMEHLSTFVEGGAVSFWRMVPLDSALVDADRSIYCLGEQGREYILYFAAGGSAGLVLPEGRYESRWFDPREGVFTATGTCVGGPGTSDAVQFAAPDDEDWALLVRKASER